jgi:hypothetical protein
MSSERICAVAETHSQQIEREVAHRWSGAQRSKLEASVMVRRSFTSVSVRIACVLAAVGCGADPAVDLGHSDPPAVLGASLTDYQGTWEGYAEAYHWSDSTDVIRLQLDANGNGVLEVGDPNTPAPDLAPDPSSKPDLKPLPHYLSPGFSYPVDGATVTSRRIRIATASQVAWNDWCDSFTPVADPQLAGNFTCVLNVGFSWDANDPAGCRLMDAQRTPITCTSVYCASVCACTETSCGARVEGDDVQIDAALMSEGDELAGTLVAGSERISIRMLRSP